MKFATLAAGMVALLTSVSITQAEEFRMLSGWPENQSYTVNAAIPFIEKVKELSNGEITIQLDGPEVVAPFEQIEPVQMGVFDLLFTHPAYHIGTAAIGLGIEGTKSDPELRRSSGVFDTMDEYYQGLGLKAIAVAPVGSVAFNFILKDPVGDSPSLTGRKIRGTQTYNPVIEGLGASPVVLPMPDIYSALQTGVIDGAGTTLTGLKEKKWYEVAGYLSRPKFGVVSLFIFMNLEKWNALSDEQKEIMEKAAVALESETSDKFDALAAEEEAFLLENGMQISEMPQEDAEQVNKMIFDGAWKTASAAGPLAEKMHEQAREAGLAE
ncbi:TRAP transporter substrate-binding protein DctP [Notoacmeibacter sp. MSK16QG-6]|uniref:TRAP transporter substrate-binding protein DctP n=1 Tax=Notoacmeibacter sp. MSK16QG-6 TaxID=2957982 RepID=UPI00209E80D9|nr:TRAP transporter substrate-binding protein DctP [Notoacmeibacter sp. MSK16QG-6]MCP1198353.1 TRAP transporter substrate-binding protein DctP [Notoacmeibacter sp. MSK16QG-6]